MRLDTGADRQENCPWNRLPGSAHNVVEFVDSFDVNSIDFGRTGSCEVVYIVLLGGVVPHVYET